MRTLIQYLAVALTVLPALLSCSEETYRTRVIATNDTHGAVFPQGYDGSGALRPSLASVCAYVDSTRDASGADHVILLDCGDHLQGDNATYYFNYVDSTGEKHLLSRIFNFMGYDAAVVGNHDLEAGHPVYDRMARELDCPYLAANAVRESDGEAYFDRYAVIDRGGLKVAVIGFTNANVKSWISKDKYEGLEFLPVDSVVSRLVSEVRRKERPDVVILAVHCGLGEADVPSIENNAMYLAAHVPGIDAVIASHDHRKIAVRVAGADGDSVCVVESGSRAGAVSLLDIEVVKKGRKVVAKKIVPSVEDVPASGLSQRYMEEFGGDWKTVLDFSNRVIGRLVTPLDMSYREDRRSDYLALIHYVQLSCPGVDVSFTAPLVDKGVMPAGPIRFNDLFTLYRFENLLYVVRMSGREIHDYLEGAYDKRICRTDYLYNYDTAGGLVYTVDPSAEKGRRVHIISMADGTPFDEDRMYSVAMTSYRASGAGGLLAEAGLDRGAMDSRIEKIYPEIRMMLCDFIESKVDIDPARIAREKKTGSWRFIK